MKKDLPPNTFQNRRASREIKRKGEQWEKNIIIDLI
jgi:hypothetical protein